MIAATGLPAQALGRRGGRLVAGLSAGADGALADLAHGNMFRRACQSSVFDTLTEITADGSLIGDLATAWEPNPDAKVWHLTLRDDVTFHDGTPFSSADVVAALTSHRSDLLQDVVQISARRPLEVEIVLAHEDANLPYRLANPDLFVARDGVGTGLYQLGRYSSEHLLARRVEQHWKDGRAGWFDEVELLALPDSTHRMAALRSGRVDVIDAPDAHSIRLLQSNSDMTLAQNGAYALSQRIATPTRIGQIQPMDNARFTERWWRA